MINQETTYEKIADKFIALLKIKCNLGVFAEHLFRQVERGNSQFYTLEKIIWMEDFLKSANENIAASCLRCLCSKGKNLADYRQLLVDRIMDKMFSSKAIAIAEDFNQPQVLVVYMDESLCYVNRVILALKRTHNESYLTPFMFSENEKLAKVAMKIAKK